MEISQTQGKKYDSGKPRMDLLSPIALAYVSQVLTYGAQKYAANNWRSGIAFSRILGACQRHLTAIAAGIDIDPETGLPHAAHLMCEVMFLLELRETHPECDDRYKYKSSQVGLLEALLASGPEYVGSSGNTDSNAAAQKSNSYYC